MSCSAPGLLEALRDYWRGRRIREVSEEEEVKYRNEISLHGSNDSLELLLRLRLRDWIDCQCQLWVDRCPNSIVIFHRLFLHLDVAKLRLRKLCQISGGNAMAFDPVLLLDDCVTVTFNRSSVFEARLALGKKARDLIANLINQRDTRGSRRDCLGDRCKVNHFSLLSAGCDRLRDKCTAFGSLFTNAKRGLSPAYQPPQIKPHLKLETCHCKGDAPMPPVCKS
jgi:hypothetical protein